MGTASRKRRRIAAKYHPEDIQECFHKVHRQFNSMHTFNLMQCTIQSYTREILWDTQGFFLPFDLV